MSASKLAALYLFLLGLGLATVAYTFSNGTTVSKLSWLGLSQARLGLYYHADAIKEVRSAAFFDAEQQVQARVAQHLVAAIRGGEVTLHQRTPCIRNTYARGCNLPVIELSLGLALGLSVLFLSMAGVFWLGSTVGALGLVLIAALIGGSGHLWLEQARLPTSSPLSQLHQLEVGVYRNIEPLEAKPDPNDGAWLDVLNARALQSVSYCRRLTFTTNCGVTVIEMPLSAPVLVSGGGLVGLLVIALVGFRRSRSEPAVMLEDKPA